MPQYLILLYEDEQSWAEASDEKSAEILAAHGAFGEQHRDALRGGSALQPQATADLDEALAIAREVPAPFGGVEVRPVRVFD